MRAFQPILYRSTKPKLRFERLASLANQIIARVAPARIQLSRSGLPAGFGAFCNEDGLSADIDFRVRRSARKLFDSAAIPIARRKIHIGEITACPQFLVDQTDAFKEIRPIKFGYEPHAGDDIADGYVSSALPPVFFAHDFIGICTLRI